MLNTDIISEFAISGVIILLLGIGTFTDFRKREVPDWISYGSIVLGLGLSFILSVITANWNIIVYSLLGGTIFTGIALAMFYLGQWGGGDSKMLMGLGTLIGFNFSVISSRLMPDLIQYFLLIILIGAFYGLVWSFFLLVANSKNFVGKYKKISKKHTVIKRVILLVSLLIFIVAIFMPFFIKIILLAVIVAAIPSFYIWLYAKAVESSSMQRYISPEMLVEGDWLVKEIKVSKKVIASPKDLGITMGKIEELIKLKKEGKIDKVLIKEGIPFVPSFLIAYVILLVMNYYGINLVQFFL